MENIKKEYGYNYDIKCTYSDIMQQGIGGLDNIPDNLIVTKRIFQIKVYLI